MGLTGEGGRQMRPAMVVSALGHAGVILFAIAGFGAPEPPAEPISFSDVSVVSEADFFTAVATAPVEAPEIREGLEVPETVPATEVRPDAADPNVQTTDAAALGPTGAAAADPAERPAAVAVRPLRPRDAPAPSTRPVPQNAIAEAPPEAASSPDTRPTTEPVQPLASTPATPPPGLAEAPPAPEPEPERAAETEVAEAEGDVAPETARVPLARPNRPAAPVETAEAEPEPEQPDADVLAALNAATASIEAVNEAGEEKKPAASKPARQAATAPTRGQQLARGERDGLSLAVKDHFTYNGRREGNLVVTLEVQIDASGSIVSGPKQIAASGGDSATQKALYSAARRALLKAEIAGAFRPLGPKLATWSAIQFRFTPDERVGFSS
ncbi:MAG: hypothetical protein AAF371_09660 [Pseudomonadota bacterium]